MAMRLHEAIHSILRMWRKSQSWLFTSSTNLFLNFLLVAIWLANQSTRTLRGDLSLCVSHGRHADTVQALQKGSVVHWD